MPAAHDGRGAWNLADESRMREQHHELRSGGEPAQLSQRALAEIRSAFPRSWLGVHKDEALPVACCPSPDGYAGVP